MSAGSRAIVRWVVGMVASGAMIYMSFRSMSAGFSLSPYVIAGMLALIVLLVYGVEPLEDLIDSWRGRGGDRNG